MDVGTSWVLNRFYDDDSGSHGKIRSGLSFIVRKQLLPRSLIFFRFEGFGFLPSFTGLDYSHLLRFAAVVIGFNCGMHFGFGASA